MSPSNSSDNNSALPPGSRVQQEEDIQEVVLLQIIQPPTQGEPIVVFISVNGQDPNPDFLQRFSPHRIIAKPKSESEWVYVPSYGSLDPNAPNAIISETFLKEVIDPSTGQSSAIYSAGRVEWVDNMTVKLSGGWVAGSLAALYSDYEVRWNGQTWQITEEVETWIS